MVFGSKKTKKESKIPPPKFCPQSDRRTGLDSLTNTQSEPPQMEDPDVTAARQEQEKRRKDKHRKMEADRERLRQHIREKYNLKKKQDGPQEEIAGRITGNRKTPEQVALETLNAEEDEGLMSALTDTFEKAKSSVASACTTVKNVMNLWRT
ncbi:unnamed protein product [Caenorhabditis sp. 36 PRJEB53466]|nr:unnamed protein product [Caenorhabditis sp. 36 PRJEB53466]